MLLALLFGRIPPFHGLARKPDTKFHIYNPGTARSRWHRTDRPSLHTPRSLRPWINFLRFLVLHYFRCVASLFRLCVSQIKYARDLGAPAALQDRAAAPKQAPRWCPWACLTRRWIPRCTQWWWGRMMDPPVDPALHPVVVVGGGHDGPARGPRAAPWWGE